MKRSAAVMMLATLGLPHDCHPQPVYGADNSPPWDGLLRRRRTMHPSRLQFQTPSCVCSSCRPSKTSNFNRGIRTTSMCFVAPAPFFSRSSSAQYPTVTMCPRATAARLGWPRQIRLKLTRSDRNHDLHIVGSVGGRSKRPHTRDQTRDSFARREKHWSLDHRVSTMTAPQQVFLHGEALSGESETGWTRSPLTSGDNRGEIVHDEDNAEDSGSGSMITTLRVDNLAMVDCVHVELGPGLITITGETGAGKSLISNAFSLAAGARVRGVDIVGARGPTARVQLGLELADEHRAPTMKLLERFGVPVEDEGRRLSVTRTVGGKGSSASVNGCSVKVGDLRELMSPLIYTVDANAFELFSRADGRLRALDRMLDSAEVLLADKVRQAVAHLQQAEACRARLEQRCRFEGGPEGGEDASLLHHWVEELDEFGEGEAAFMERMRAVVENFVDNWGEDILGPLAEPLLAATSSVTYKGQSDGDVGSQSGRSGGPMGEAEGLSALWPRLSRIREGMEDLEASRTKVELARQMAVDQSNPESIARALGKIRDLLIDAEDENVGLSQQLLEETHEDLNSLEACLKRAGNKLEASVQSLPVLPITLEEVESRTDKWRDLSRKHGVPPERLGVMQAQLRVELDELVVAAEALPLAREKEESWRNIAQRLAGYLTAVRQRAAVQVEQLINPMMADVGLDGTTLQVVLEESKTLGSTGADRVQFVMQANHGQTMGTVDALASSGEKSRLLLLLETLLPPPHARPSIELPGRSRRHRGIDDDGDAGHASDAQLEETDADAFLMEAGVTAAVDRGSDDRGESFGSDKPFATAGAKRAAPCAVLYDEIDAHVGGRTAVAVGRLLANQGRKSQVVVITHTASVAALADQHLVVDKISRDAAPRRTMASPLPLPLADTDDISSAVAWRSRRHGGGVGDDVGGVSVAVREVQGREREEEVARMAAGDMGGGAAAELAREMLRYSSGRRRRQDDSPR